MSLSRRINNAGFYFHLFYRIDRHPVKIILRVRYSSLVANLGTVFSNKRKHTI